MSTDMAQKETHNALQLLQVASTLDYIGEPVSQLDHALQCAYFAEQSRHSDDVILACLFHDIGHFASSTAQHSMDNLGVLYHEWIGAKLAYEHGFSAKVALLIGYHVDAKRYLAGKKTSYYAQLSAASRSTLAFQGGPMNEKEMHQFEGHPYFKEILQVRVNDEKGKNVGLQVPPISYYAAMIKKHLQKNEKHNAAMLKIDLMDFIDNAWIKKLKAHLEAIV